jgi:glutathione gamma-glutamylcysteinyltransferase
MNSRSALQRSLKCASSILSRETTPRVRVASMPIATVEVHGRQFFSSVAVASAWDDGTKNSSYKHCDTCTCEEKETTYLVDSSPPFPCGNPHHEDDHGTLPPPLPEPRYSVHKRVLPSSLTALSSPDGRKYLIEAFTENTAESYWALTEQFVNQNDPAFCGVTTLLMVLNAMCIDPQVRWRGGWRFYGSEDVLLDRCCLSAERIRRVGVTMEEFRLLGRCHGLSVKLKRPQDRDNESFTVDDFRKDIRRILTDAEGHSIFVVSFSRQHLGQTGDGHFSPLAAYHEPTDKVLLLDVARFKYAPYWVSVQDLYDSMELEDSVTRKSRGWFLLHPPKNHACLSTTHEDRRPAELVPQVGDQDACPVGKVKVDFCKANPHRS